MTFKGFTKTLHYIQLNTGHIDEVFPLLCPVREKDWLDGWDYTMIYSESGLIEKDCVFSTPHHGAPETVWYVTQYDRDNYTIEFLRVTPEENTVRINIRLESAGDQTTKTFISYRYTALTIAQNDVINTNLEITFTESMAWWEKAINHYLQTGKMLRKG